MCPTEAKERMIPTKTRYKLAIIAPTCFYYQVALFRTLAAHPRIDLTVYFCSDEALRARDAQEMYHTDQKWGDEDQLLVGYRHTFLPNHSPFPSYLKWPYGLMNFSIWNEIKNNRPDIVVLMSWMNVTWWITIVACVRYRIPFLYMTDANVQAELQGPRWKKWIKKLFLGNCVFKLATGFLCAGTANQMLYRFYGVPEEKLVPFGYSWGYEDRLQAWEELRPIRQQLRAEQGIPDDSFVILYCGRLSQEKRPLDLFKAYGRVNRQNKFLAIVGDGELRSSLQQYATKHGLDSVRLFGFQNRNEINKFYVTADILVLPSKRETWGIVINEALCFALPVITSDQVGAARDLIRDGDNGLIYPSGDVDELTACLQQLVELPENERLKWGTRSQERIRDWLDRELTQSLDQYFDFIYSQRQPRNK